ncbi:MAG: hypothetical protein BYD32DRAFT_413760 [Podila humilis]|nr:MAG: hypothetical protein BYD32DRAFT_413760 [Podila humilis]
MHQELTEIPEILAHIARYSSPQDLFACVQVSFQWHQSFIPSLWHTIDDTTQSWSNILWQIGDPSARSTPWSDSLEDKAKDSDKNKDRDWLLQVFRKHARHIRNLTIHWPTVLEAASLASPLIDSGSSDGLALRSLTTAMRNPQPPRPVVISVTRPPAMAPAVAPTRVSPPLFPGFVEEDDFTQPRIFGLSVELQRGLVESGWVWTQHFWHLVFSNPSLERLIVGTMLKVEWSCKPGRGPMNQGRILMKNLREVQGWGFHDTTGIWRFLRAAPNIESLSVDCYEYKLPDPLPAVNLTLRHLRVDIPMTVWNLLTILGLFPCLTSLVLPSIVDQQQLEELTPPPRITPLASTTQLCLDVGFVGNWDTVLLHLPELRELTHNGNFRMSMITAIATYCPRFQALRRRSQPWLIDEQRGRLVYEPTNELLVASSSLRVLDSIRNILRVDDVLRQPWACMGLEWLCCWIVGIERLTVSEQALVDRVLVPGYTGALTADETVAVEKFHRCSTQQHGVYDRLAGLVKLKHLDLGFENRNPMTQDNGERYEVDGEEYVRYAGPTFDTLELSLASGLDRLGALKDLEMIGFECVNHRIRKRELEWMAKAWPKLKSMYGLDKERLPMIEPDQERAALREYFRLLRPDVNHDSSFENIDIA